MGVYDNLIMWILIGFAGLILLSIILTMFILWKRRRLIFTNFLSETSQWERKGWYPEKIGKTFVYDNETYEYDIALCTRDRQNRPIAHYYKGNPKQQQFDYQKGNKKIVINTKEITAKDFMVLMLSKVLRDIFQDDEVMSLLMIILIVTIVGTIINGVLILTRNPTVILTPDNTTITTIAQGVRVAIANG